MPPTNGQTCKEQVPSIEAARTPWIEYSFLKEKILEFSSLFRKIKSGCQVLIGYLDTEFSWMKTSGYIIYCLLSMGVLSFLMHILFLQRYILNIPTFYPLFEKNRSINYRMYHLLKPH